MMMMMNPNEMFMQFGSIIATIMFMKALYQQYIPYQWRDSMSSYSYRYTEGIVKYFSPYNHIIVEEYGGERFKRSEAYTTIQTYLSDKTSMKARRLKATFVKDGKSLVLGLGDNEEVTDEFQGVKVWWNARKISSKSQTISFYPGVDEKRYYKVTFHSRYKNLITESYMNYVIDQGKEIAIRRRQRKLFTNVNESSSLYGRNPTLWSHIEFNHPATFDTLAMEKSKKQAIHDDLVHFSQAKDYYKKIGKPWKRGYLLYGPPGTGKSTMIAVMANLLGYDIYDLELTSVKDNTQLRRLLIETSSKSIIVIEDIDCSLDLTGQRSSQKKQDSDDENNKEKNEIDEIKKKMKEQGETKKSEVTLSGLLNFIDGIWSGCGEERIIIFTTNYIDKLDPALIRRGRMDMHIELSYCSYEAFKVLALNYLDIESHPLFETIRGLLEEIKMTPADVAENLMRKSFVVDVDACLENLVRALEKAREDDRLKVEQEENEEAKLKSKKEENKLTANETEQEEKEKAKLKLEEEENKFTTKDGKLQED